MFSNAMWTVDSLQVNRWEQHRLSQATESDERGGPGSHARKNPSFFHLRDSDGDETPSVAEIGRRFRQ